MGYDSSWSTVDHIAETVGFVFLVSCIFSFYGLATDIFSCIIYMWRSGVRYAHNPDVFHPNVQYSRYQVLGVTKCCLEYSQDAGNVRSSRIGYIYNDMRQTNQDTGNVQ